MRNKTWQIQEAKNKFSSLVKSAQEKGPQIVTRRGVKTVVVLSYEEYEEMARPKDDLVTFLQDSPLAKVGIDLSREKDFPRDTEV